MGRHIFLSYVRENEGEVTRLAEALERSGLEPWLDRNRLSPGTRWREAIRKAIRSGALFLACFSRHSMAKERSYMNEELTLAIDELRQRPTDRSWFVPVILDGGEVPPRPISAAETLHDLQWVDLTADWEKGVQDIVRLAAESIGAILRRTRKDETAPSIFLSYSSSAAVYAAVLRSHLTEYFTFVPVQLGNVASIQEQISARIAQADYFLAVWHPNSSTPETISPWLSYEYGVATALHKPTLVLVSRYLPNHIWQRIERRPPIPAFDESDFERRTVPLVIEYCRANWKKDKA